MSGTTAQRAASDARVVAPITALAMLAVQVGANATSGALFLTSFPVTDLPWFVAAAALLTFPLARITGALLGRHGPRRVVPVTFALSGALFVAEAWLLVERAAAAAVLLYFHTTVIGAVATSAFWSLLNERFDPQQAKKVFSWVAGAATLGAVLGGAGAARVATTWSIGALLALLALGGAVCAVGSLVVGRGGERGGSECGPAAADTSGAVATRPYVRELALLAMLAALVGTLCDYLLKADVAAYIAGGAPLVRFFGLFYAATGIAAFAIQAACAPAVLGRLGIAGALAIHPAAVGLAGLAGLVTPSPWRGIAIRGADATLRRSLFRTGYELLYTPLPDETRRSAKTAIDVGWDCVGSLSGAGVVVALTRLLPARAVLALTVACIAGALLELAATRRLPSGYLHELGEKLRRRGQALPRATHYSFSRLTVPHVPMKDDEYVSTTQPAAPNDLVVRALAALRSSDARRIGPALRTAETEPSLVGAVIPLLGRKDLFNDAAIALKAHGTRVAGQLVDALLDPATPEDVRGRLPLVLASSASRLALEGLVQGLTDAAFKVRHRCCRALLQMTAGSAALSVSRQTAYAAAERELDAGAGDPQSMAHVFDLLALVHDRGMMDIAGRACETGDAQARGTALAYLETTLPRALFAKLERRFGSGPPPSQPDRAGMQEA